MAKKKSWREKLESAKDLPKVIDFGPEAAAKYGAQTLAIPAPLDVDAIMKTVPKGKLITIKEIRERIATAMSADSGCPLTCGIFAWIAAHAAAEDEAAGKKRVTPWWRTLKSGGELNPKFPGGFDAQTALLEAEGHEVFTKGKRRFVRDFAKKVVHA